MGFQTRAIFIGFLFSSTNKPFYTQYQLIPVLHDGFMKKFPRWVEFYPSLFPNFKKKRMIDIKASDVVAWQNKIMAMTDETGQHYSMVYLKSIHNQLPAIFNHAVKFYDLPKNPALIAGNMGKEKAKEINAIGFVP